MHCLVGARTRRGEGFLQKLRVSEPLLHRTTGAERHSSGSSVITSRDDSKQNQTLVLPLAEGEGPEIWGSHYVQFTPFSLLTI